MRIRTIFVRIRTETSLSFIPQKTGKQRDKIIENLRQQQYKQHNQNINRQEHTEQPINKNTNHEINQEINSLPKENLI